MGVTALMVKFSVQTNPALVKVQGTSQNWALVSLKGQQFPKETFSVTQCCANLQTQDRFSVVSGAELWGWFYGGFWKKEGERMGGSAQNNVDITSLSKSIFLGLYLNFLKLALKGSH